MLQQTQYLRRKLSNVSKISLNGMLLMLSLFLLLLQKQDMLVKHKLMHLVKKPKLMCQRS